MGDKANIREFDREFNKFIILESDAIVNTNDADDVTNEKRSYFEFNIEFLDNLLNSFQLKEEQNFCLP